MSATKDLELTIRTALLIKSLSSLVNTRDPHLAQMMFRESVEQVATLGKFIDGWARAKATGSKGMSITR